MPHLCSTWLLSLSGYSYQYQRHTQRATGPVATSLPHMAPVPRLATAVSILTSYPGQRLFASRKPSLPARCFLLARKRKTTERAWAAVMYQAATTGIKERRPSVIMAWGHRPWLSQTSKHERPCSCMLPSFFGRTSNKKNGSTTKQRKKGSP